MKTEPALRERDGRLILLTVVFIAVTTLLITLRPSDAMNQDLGRHLKLGKIIWETKSIPATNLFSYTHPDFPFINHHWLSEVFFYGMERLGGLPLIFTAKIVALLAALGGCVWLARKKTSWAAVSAATLLVLPLLAERIDERPELFAYLLFAALLIIFLHPRATAKMRLVGAPIVMLFWINLHLSFAIGLAAIAIFAAENAICGKNKKEQLSALAPLILSGLVTIANPNGLKGALYPLSVFGNYGYRIIENQSVFFLLPRLASPSTAYLLAVAIIAAALIIIKIVKTRRAEGIGLLALALAVASLVAVRNAPFFLFAAIPAVASALSGLVTGAGRKRVASAACLAWSAALLVFYIATASPAMGIQESARGGTDFFLRRGIPGNIFNNFDIGGYLDYRLYPHHRVFVDNRPEAFPASFFEEYIRIQEDPEFRKQQFEKYGINSIIFGHRDITPWARSFLAQITSDKNWKTAYLDGFIIILVRNESAQTKTPSLDIIPT